jgi:hypothetical protein
MYGKFNDKPSKLLTLRFRDIVEGKNSVKMNVFKGRNVPEQIRRNLYAHYARRTAACLNLMGLIRIEQHYIAGRDGTGLVLTDDPGTAFYNKVYFKITMQMRRAVDDIDQKKIDVPDLRMLDNFEFVNQIQPP